MKTAESKRIGIKETNVRICESIGSSMPIRVTNWTLQMEKMKRKIPIPKQMRLERSILKIIDIQVIYNIRQTNANLNKVVPRMRESSTVHRRKVIGVEIRIASFLSCTLIMWAMSEALANASTGSAKGLEPEGTSADEISQSCAENMITQMSMARSTTRT